MFAITVFEDKKGEEIYSEGRESFAGAYDEIELPPQPTEAQDEIEPDTEAPPNAEDEPTADTDRVSEDTYRLPSFKIPDRLPVIDFDKLLAINPDIIGWIYVPGTKIDYPLLKSKDNDDYVKLTYNLKKSKYGSIFMDMRNKTDFTSRNTIIYGHNLKNGDMFATLKNYQNQSYMDAHPYVYILTPTNIYVYQATSSYYTKNSSDTYKTKFASYETLDKFLEHIDNGTRSSITPSRRNRILTLSTCKSGSVDDNRTVVHYIQRAVFKL